MVPKTAECEVHYYPDQIVLKGAEKDVHLEANKILLRFACSARPFRVVEDQGDQMVLAPAG
jgi:hypothetical protein